MVAYNIGMKVKIKVAIILQNDIDIEPFSDKVVDGMVEVEIIRLVKGRTWEIQLPDGERMQTASRNFKVIVEADDEAE